MIATLPSPHTPDLLLQFFLRGNAALLYKIHFKSLCNVDLPFDLGQVIDKVNDFKTSLPFILNISNKKIIIKKTAERRGFQIKRLPDVS